MTASDWTSLIIAIAGLLVGLAAIPPTSILLPLSRKILASVCLTLIAVALGIAFRELLFPPTSNTLPTPSNTLPTSTESEEPEPTPPPSAPSPPTALAEPPGQDGIVDGLAPMEGYDFDFGVRSAPEDVPGLDISGRHMNYVLDSVATTSGGRLARLVSGPGPHDKSDCERPEIEWTKNVPGVPVGDSICIRTSEGNLAILTITKAWTGQGEEDSKIGFTYRTWYD